MSNTGSCNVGNMVSTLFVFNWLLAGGIFHLEAPTIIAKCFIQNLCYHISTHVTEFLSSWTCVFRVETEVFEPIAVSNYNIAVVTALCSPFRDETSERSGFVDKYRSTVMGFCER